MLAGLGCGAGGGVSVVLHERRLHVLDLRQGIVDGGLDAGVKVGIQLVDEGLHRVLCVALACHTAHVGVLHADDVVVEVLDGFLAVGGFDVGDILAVVGLADLGGAHFVGDGGAAVHDLHDGGGAGGVGAARLPSVAHVGAEGVAVAHGAVEFELFHHFAMVCGRLAAEPTHLQLEAAVAEVAGDGHHIDHLVVGDLRGALGLAIGEEDVLDAVEAEQRVAETLAGHHVAVVAVQRLNHGGTVHQGVEGGLVQRPGVDVRVDAEVACGTEQEGLAHLPLGTGLQEDVAGGGYVGVGAALLKRLQGVNQLGTLRRQG